MQQLLQLSPTNLPINDLLGQFQKLTGQGLPDFGSFATDLPLPDVSQLTGLVAQFEEIGQKLAEGPAGLTGELLGQLQQLGDGSTQISGLLGSITEAIGPVGGLPGQLQSFFGTFETVILPLLATIQRQEFDAESLTKLLNLDNLLANAAQPLTGLMQAPLETVGSLESSLAPLAESSWLADYQSLLAGVKAIEAGASATAEAQLAALNQALSDDVIAQLQQGVKTLETGTETAVNTLTSFGDSLDGLSQNVTAEVQAIFDRLNPAALGQQLNIVDEALTAQLEQLDLAGMVGQIEAAVQALNDLIDQNLAQVTATIEQLVGTVTQAIDMAKQALVQVSALISDLLNQVRTFLEGPMATVSDVIEQAKGVFNSFAVSINGVLEQVNGVITQVYDFIKGVIEQIAAFDFEPFIQQLYNMIRQMTAILDHPEVRRGLEQVKTIIDQIVQQLDQISLQPVFDQVLTNVDSVKAQLAAIDTSQLNAMLRQALKAALEVVTSAIDPPSKVTDMVKEEYNSSVRPNTLSLIEPIEEQFLKILDIVDQFEPGTLVANLLTPPFEAMLAELEKLIGPDQILSQLSVITDFYESLLAELDAQINPANLLAPITEYYGILMEFVNSLSPEILLAPLNELLEMAKNEFNKLPLETIVEQVKAPVDEIVGFVTDFRLEDQPFWQPVQAALNIQLKELVEQFVTLLKEALAQIDLSALQPVTAAVGQAIQTLQEVLIQPELLERVQAFVSGAGAAAQTFLGQITALADEWRAAYDHVKQIAANAADSAAFNELLAKLEALNPIKLLAAPTSLVRQLQTGVTSLLERIQAIWAGLGDLLDQGAGTIQTLLSNEPDGLKAYLAEIVDGLVGGPLQRIVEWLDPAMTGIRRAIEAILGLQEHLDVFKILPESLERISQAILSVKQAILDFNFDFLTDELQGIMDTVIQPLRQLDPQPFIDELVAIYQRVMSAVSNLNPVNIIASARGVVTLNREQAEEALLVPVGARLVAQTPVGEMHYQVIQGATLAAGVASVDILVQAISQGRGGEVIAPGATGEVEWRMNVPEGSILAALKPGHTEPLLSLYTMFHDIIIGKLQALHPEKLLVEPLNEPYQRVLQIKEELGLDRPFKLLFTKFDQLEEELFDGLDRSAAAFGSLLSAIPL
jgi:phage-related protein